MARSGSAGWSRTPFVSGSGILQRRRWVQGLGFKVCFNLGNDEFRVEEGLALEAHSGCKIKILLRALLRPCCQQGAWHACLEVLRRFLVLKLWKEHGDFGPRIMKRYASQLAGQM